MRLSRLVAMTSGVFLVLNTLVATPATAADPCPDSSAFTGITGLALWLRADCVNGSANAPADNSTVSTWMDISGNGNNATASGSPTFQSDAANLINSQPVINFNGSSRFSSIDIRAITRPNITIFSVYKVRGSGNREGVWGVDNGSWDRFFIAKWSGNDGLISAGNSAGVTNSGVIGAPTLITSILKYNVSNGSTVYRNGDLAVTLTDQASVSDAATSMSIGAFEGGGGNFTGDISEIIIFSQALTSSDLKTVNGYLNTKYNLGIAAGNLPVAVTAPTFNSFALAGGVTTATYRGAVVMTANVNQQSKVSFTANGKSISVCRNIATSGSGSSHTASCTWRPSTRGSVSLNVRAIGSVGGLVSSLTSPLRVLVSNRTSLR